MLSKIVAVVGEASGACQKEKVRGGMKLKPTTAMSGATKADRQQQENGNGGLGAWVGSEGHGRHQSRHQDASRWRPSRSVTSSSSLPE